MSITIDPMNQPEDTKRVSLGNDTYVEVKEARAGVPNGFITYIVQIRGDDLSVRPLYNYKDSDPQKTLIPGVLADMGLISPAAAEVTFSDEGRITASSSFAIHRLVPGDPATAQNAPVTSYILPP
jgi:hypothetical protein